MHLKFPAQSGAHLNVMYLIFLFQRFRSKSKADVAHLTCNKNILQLL